MTTIWVPESSEATPWPAEQTTSVYDSTGTYDGAELSATDSDLTYDGHVATPPLSTIWTQATGPSTIWS